MGSKILDKVPFIYRLSPKTKTLQGQFLEIEEMSHILDLPDQFNELFADKGWICYSSLSQSAVEKSVQLALESNFEQAYELLINTVDEAYIDLILQKCKCRKHFQDRLTLLELLKIDYLEQRYHACIPLLLALLDGLANDTSKHIGFFTEGLDLELFDSITAHETGLPFLKAIMNSSRKTTITQKIHIPYRNGILHGRDLNFNHKEVASKCWWALASLLDWADEKELSKQPEQKKSSSQTINDYQETKEYSKRIAAWQKRPTEHENYWIEQTLETVETDSPEYALLIFLTAWKAKQWGKMTPLLLHNIGKHEGTATKEVLNDYKKFELLSYQIKHSEDQTPASTKILTHVEYIKNDANYKLEVNISLNYANSIDGSPELRGESNSKWYILQVSLRDILFN